ncbi:hypothetical protein Tco_0853029 [Tanacetum coccineum]
MKSGLRRVGWAWAKTLGTLNSWLSCWENIPPPHPLVVCPSGLNLKAKTIILQWRYDVSYQKKELGKVEGDLITKLEDGAGLSFNASMDNNLHHSESDDLKFGFGVLDIIGCSFKNTFVKEAHKLTVGNTSDYLGLGLGYQHLILLLSSDSVGRNSSRLLVTILERVKRALHWLMEKRRSDDYGIVLFIIVANGNLQYRSLAGCSSVNSLFFFLLDYIDQPYHMMDVICSHKLVLRIEKVILRIEKAILNTGD